MLQSVITSFFIFAIFDMFRITPLAGVIKYVFLHLGLLLNNIKHKH